MFAVGTGDEGCSIWSAANDTPTLFEGGQNVFATAALPVTSASFPLDHVRLVTGAAVPVRAKSIEGKIVVASGAVAGFGGYGRLGLHGESPFFVPLPWGVQPPPGLHVFQSTPSCPSRQHDLRRSAISRIPPSIF